MEMQKKKNNQNNEDNEKKKKMNKNKVRMKICNREMIKSKQEYVMKERISKKNHYDNEIGIGK